jgi:signal transduction histidine kinase
LPLAGLVWLGYAVVEQDAAARRERATERREQILDVAVAALGRALSRAEERLTAAFANPTLSAGVAADLPAAPIAIVSFNRTTLVARAETQLPFYPVVGAGGQGDAPVDQFRAAHVAEFIHKDLGAALGLLASLRADRDATVRAEAWLRTARLHRKRHDQGQALDAYRALDELGTARAIDRPAGLVARQGRALLFESAGQRDDLIREANALIDDLAAGRWVLEQSAYRFALDQAIEWTGRRELARSMAANEAMAEAVEAIWREWRISGAQDDRTRNTRTFRTARGSVLAMWRASSDRLVVLVAGTPFLGQVWPAELTASATDAGVRLALTDGEGHAILGVVDGPPAIHALRLAAQTSLPWNVHAIGGPPDGLSGSARLTLVAVSLTGLMFLASVIVVSRAILRQVRMAALQGDFVAAVSHEFRTPLTTIRQMSELLARGRVSSDERRQAFYETLLRDSDRLQRLVENVLDFGRFESRAAEYRFETLDPVAIVREIVDSFRGDASAMGFDVELHFSGPLLPIRGDREALGRAIWNLLDNAVKYSRDSRHIEVEVVAAVRYHVIGIPAE